MLMSLMAYTGVASYIATITMLFLEGGRARGSFRKIPTGGQKHVGRHFGEGVRMVNGIQF